MFYDQGRGPESKGSWFRRIWKFENLRKFFSAKNGFRRSQDGLEKELNKVFGDGILGDLKPSQRNNNCIAAAIATKISNDDKKDDFKHNSKPDLKVFDTSTKLGDFKLNSVFIKDAILASCNTGKYFRTPKNVTNRDGDDLGDYFDAKVVGDCPLAEALPRLLEIYGYDESRIETVISIAPQHPKNSSSLVG